MTEGFYSFSITVPFYVEDLSEEEDVKIVWKEKVEKVFETYNLSCLLDWDEGKMRVETTPQTKTKKWDLLRKGGDALSVLAAGLTTKYVEPILDGSFICDIVYINKPDDIMESDFARKYEDSMNTFGEEMKCHERLSCMVLFQEAAVISLSKSKDATRLVSHFVIFLSMKTILISFFVVYLKLQIR